MTEHSEPNVHQNDAPSGERTPCGGTTPLDAPNDVLVSKRGGQYLLYDSRLGLLVTHKDLATGYAQLEKERSKRLCEFAEAGILHWLPETAGPSPTQPQSLLSRIKPFLLKAAIVTALFFTFLGAISGSLRDAGYGLEKKLEGLSNWSPEQVEWHRARAEKIAEKLGPTIRELLVMFRDQPPVGKPNDEPEAGRTDAVEQGKQ